MIRIYLTKANLAILITLLIVIFPKPGHSTTTLCAGSSCAVVADGFFYAATALFIYDFIDKNVADGQKGAGRKKVTFKVDDSEKKIIVTNSGEVQISEGKGAWTRLGDSVTTISESNGKLKLDTKGNWMNASHHAHWLGDINLVFKKPDGNIVGLHLLSDSQWTGKKVGGPERIPKSWSTTTPIPNGFWNWIKTPGVEALFSINAKRLK